MILALDTRNIFWIFRHYNLPWSFSSCSFFSFAAISSANFSAFRALSMRISSVRSNERFRGTPHVHWVSKPASRAMASIFRGVPAVRSRTCRVTSSAGQFHQAALSSRRTSVSSNRRRRSRAGLPATIP